MLNTIYLIIAFFLFIFAYNAYKMFPKYNMLSMIKPKGKNTVYYGDSIDLKTGEDDDFMTQVNINETEINELLDKVFEINKKHSSLIH